MAGGGGGMMNWEIGIDMYTLICIKWITNKNLLYQKISKYNSKPKKSCFFSLNKCSKTHPYTIYFICIYHKWISKLIPSFLPL